MEIEILKFKDTMLHPKDSIRKKIINRIKLNDGYCPCVSENSEDTKCPCLEYRVNHTCHCNLYIKSNVMNETEKAIMEALYKGLTYKEIMSRVDGVNSKGLIKKTIKKYNPELYAIIRDTKKLKEFRDERN